MVILIWGVRYWCDHHPLPYERTYFMDPQLFNIKDSLGIASIDTLNNSVLIYFELVSDNHGPDIKM